MFDYLTTVDLIAVYDRLKDRYPLELTNTFAVDDGFTEDMPIIVGRHHGQVLWLYEYGGDFVLDIMDAAHTRGTHWHPQEVDDAVEDVAEFMEGRADYKLHRFKRT